MKFFYSITILFILTTSVWAMGPRGNKKVSPADHIPNKIKNAWGERKSVSDNSSSQVPSPTSSTSSSASNTGVNYYLNNNFEKVLLTNKNKGKIAQTMGINPNKVNSAVIEAKESVEQKTSKPDEKKQEVDGDHAEIKFTNLNGIPEMQQKEQKKSVGSKNQPYAAPEMYSRDAPKNIPTIKEPSLWEKFLSCFHRR